MTVLERWLAAACLCLVALLSLEWVHADKVAADLKITKDTLAVVRKSAEATQAAYATKAKALATLQAAQATRQEEVHDAIAQSPLWAADRVPDAVYDSLFKQSPGYSSE